METNLGTQEVLKSTTQPWGSETFLQYNNDAVVKILYFNEHAVTRYCYHLHRTKSMFIGYGKFILRCVNPKTGVVFEKVLLPGYQYKLDPGIAHQLQLMSKEGHIIETSKPYYSDDLYLLADNLILDDTSRPSLR